MNVKNKQPFLIGFFLCAFMVLTIGATYYKQVTGPTSSTDNAILRWDGIRGEKAQNSGITISDLGTIGNGTWSIDSSGAAIFTSASYSTLSIGSLSLTNPIPSSGITNATASRFAVFGADYRLTNDVAETGTGAPVRAGIRIISNIIATNYFDGFDVHGKYITISDNFIFRNFDTDWVSTHPDGIQLIDSTIDGHRGCQELKIIRNTIYSHPQNIFTGYYMTNILISNNVFYQEAGTILGVNLDAITTKHCGLYSGNNLIVANNFFGRAANSGVYVSYDVSQATGGITVKNNIFVDGLTGYISVYFVNSSDISSWDYNLYYNVPYAGRIAASYYDTAAAIRSSTSYEDNGIDSDPLLNGYIPMEGSPAIGAATDLSGLFTDDFTGATRTVPWDIGAYEYFESGGQSATANSATIGIIVFQ